MSLPVEIGQLLARWQSVTDVTNDLAHDIRTLLLGLLAVPDQNAVITGLQAQVTDLQARVQNLTAQVADLDQQNQILTVERDTAKGFGDTLRTKLEEARAISAALARTSGNRLDLANIPDPEKFDGTKSKLCTFLTHLRVKAACYTNEQSKLRFAINCLTGEAIDQVYPYVQDDRINLDNLAALITILGTVFGNPNRVKEAESKLLTMQQGARDFSSYFSSSSIMLWTSGGVKQTNWAPSREDWPTASRMIWSESPLNPPPFSNLLPSATN